MPKETTIKLIAKEKILLYLSQWDMDDKKFNLSIITQDGIANCLFLQRPRVTRVVAQLANEGLVREKLGFVEEKRKHKKVYSITFKGKLEKNKIEKRIGEIEVTFKNLKGVKKEVKISQIIDYLERHFKVKPNLLEILDNISGNYLECVDLEDKIIKQRESRKLGEKTFINTLPEISPFTNFYGREKELEYLKDCIESDNCKIIVVRSFPGMGKTALGYKLAQEYKDKMNILWFELEDWNSLSSVLKPFSEFLSQLNKTQLRNYISTTPKIDLNDVVEYLKRDLKDTNFLIIFDDCQEAQKEILKFFKTLKTLLAKTEKSKTILLSRKALEFYDIRDVKIKKIVLEIELEGLDENASIEFLSSRGINQSISKSLYKITKGYPLALEVVDEVHEIKKPIEITRLISEAIIFLRDVVISKMNDNEKKLMEITSVYRKPVPKDAIIFSDELNHDTIDGLVNKSLLKEFNSKEYTMHDILKELFYERLTPESKKTYHNIGARFYQKIGGELNYLEAMYHFLCAEEFKPGVEIALTKGYDLISKGYANELMFALQKFSLEKINFKQWINILELKGEIFFLLTEWDKALKCYNEVIELGRNQKNAVLASAYRNKGHIKRERSKWNDALESYEKAITISEKIEDFSGLADVHWGRGKVFWRLGNFKKAIEHFNESLVYAEKVKNILAIAKSFNDLGNVYDDEGEFDKGIKARMKALDILEKKDDLHERARIYNNIGVSYYLKEDFEKALEYWEKCIKISESFGSTSTRAWALLNASDVLVKKGNIKLGKNYLKNSLRIMRKLENKIGISQVYLTYGRIYREKKDFDKAKKYLKMSVEIAKKLQSPFDLAERYYELGLVNKVEGNPKEARFYFKKGVEIYKELGEDKLVKKLNKVLKELK